jgi:serine/threonine-protein kinase
MAPEQAAGDAQVDERADVYAIGATLTFLVPDAPRALKAIAVRASQADPAARYESVSALAADVKRYAAGLPVVAYREGLLERTRRVARRHRTPILLVAAYLLMRIVLLLVAGT